MSRTADILICGAGMTGVAAAHFLSKAGVRNILLVDEHPPLSFTSDKSTECYRNWWHDAEMLALMNHSIDLMEALAEESRNVFRMNRPLVGPLVVEGAYVTGAVSGFGIMSACGVGELLAAHVTGAELPGYAKAFTLARYDDSQYVKQLENLDTSGQL